MLSLSTTALARTSSLSLWSPSGSGETLTPPVFIDQPCTVAVSCRARLLLSSGKRTPYYRSWSLNRSNEDIQQVIVVVHGVNRNADEYFDSMVEVVESEGRLDDTAVIAPLFQKAEDGPLADEHYWSGRWSSGDPSRGDSGYSAFSVMDDIYLAIESAFPNAHTVTIVGHSAGGQYVHRYAAGGLGPDTVDVSTRFVVMNPSSYLYLDDRRVRFVPNNFPGELPFVEFDAAAMCGWYNEYKYGLEKLNPYLSALTLHALTAEVKILDHVSRRRVHYLVGELDTLADDNLDTRCPAAVQGENRRERFQNFLGHMAKFHPNLLSVSRFVTVLGVGHWSDAMMKSPELRDVLFPHLSADVLADPALLDLGVP